MRQPGAWRRISCDDQGEGARAAEVVVVAIDAGDHGVVQAQLGHGLGHAAGLVEIDGLGAALGHGAKAAAACAEVAQHHEGGGFVVPAFADVGAVSTLANGVERERAGQALERVEVFAHGSAYAQPLRLGSGDAAQGLDLNEFHHGSIVAGEEWTGSVQDAVFPGPNLSPVLGICKGSARDGGENSNGV